MADDKNKTENQTDKTSVVSKDQATGIFERVLYGLALGFAMKLVQRGWLDAEMAPYVAGGVVTAIGGAYAWWINRPKAIAIAAANIPGTVVVTTPAIAAATPGQDNIISNVATPSSIQSTVAEARTAP